MKNIIFEYVSDKLNKIVDKYNGICTLGWITHQRILIYKRESLPETIREHLSNTSVCKIKFHEELAVLYNRNTCFYQDMFDEENEKYGLQYYYCDPEFPDNLIEKVTSILEQLRLHYDQTSIHSNS